MSSEVVEASRICPICDSKDFFPAETVVNVSEIIERWQKEAQVVFTPEVLHEYSAEKYGNVSLYSCARCEFSMFYPIAEGSRQFYRAVTDKYYYNLLKWEFFQTLRDLKFNKLTSILDFGCGEGAFLDILKEKAPQIGCCGFEFCREAAEKAIQKGHTVYTDKIPDMLFDAVAAFQVIEHVADPLELITQLKKLLKPSGLLIITVPNARGPIAHFSKALTENPPHHLSRWSAHTLCHLASRLNMNINRMEYEPLPYYLWQSYLPAVWHTSWASDRYEIEAILNNIDTEQKERAEKIEEFIEGLQSTGQKWLWGTIGHTLYVALRNEPFSGSLPLSGGERNADTLRKWLNKRDNAIREREVVQFKWDDTLQHRDDRLDMKEIRLDEKEKQLDERTEQLNARENRLNLKEQQLSVQEIALNEKGEQLKSLDATILEKYRVYDRLLMVRIWRKLRKLLGIGTE